jgi:hypothetical protein
VKTKVQFNVPVKIHSFGRNGSVVFLSDGSKWEFVDSANPAVLKHWRTEDDVFLWLGNQDVPTNMLINITRFKYVNNDALPVRSAR